MGNYVITIDTGTTNTRTMLFAPNGRAAAVQKSPVGVRNTAIDGTPRALQAAVRGCLEAMLAEAGIGWPDIRLVLASGMISSNVGLLEVPHCIAPVDAAALGRAIRRAAVPEVCPLPICFIPGVRNLAGPADWDNLAQMDIMRGEETESCAIIAHFGAGRPMLLVLPGSHTKFVAVDSAGRITGCLTSMTGELLSVITNNTILADAVCHRFVEPGTYDRALMLRGYEAAKRSGMGRACFSGRILQQFGGKSPAEIANFLLGAVLQNDVYAIAHHPLLPRTADTLAVVAGKDPLRRALRDVLEYDGGFSALSVYDPPDGIPLSAAGARIIAQKAGLL
jgi:2-dehydro-3-deoxygalactonokinase